METILEFTIQIKSTKRNVDSDTIAALKAEIEKLGFPRRVVTYLEDRLPEHTKAIVKGK